MSAVSLKLILNLRPIKVCSVIAIKYDKKPPIWGYLHIGSATLSCCVGAATAWLGNIPGYSWNWSRKQEYVKSTPFSDRAQDKSLPIYGNYEFPGGCAWSARIAGDSASLAATEGKRYWKLKTRYDWELQTDNNFSSAVILKEIKIIIKYRKLREKAINHMFQRYQFYIYIKFFVRIFTISLVRFPTKSHGSVSCKALARQRVSIRESNSWE